VAKAAHNRILQNALQLIRNLMHRWIGKVLTGEGVSQAALEHHKQIFLAIAKRNTDRARAAMCAHLDAMGGYLLQTESGTTDVKTPPESQEKTQTPAV
jgi:DNA-binding FadR family transcriptional regulator